MRNANDGAATTRPQATDLDALIGPPARPKPQSDSVGDPVLLRLETDHRSAVPKDHGHVVTFYDKCPVSIRNSASKVARIDPHDRLEFNIVRGVDWTHFPVIGEPRHKTSPLALFDAWTLTPDQTRIEPIPSLASEVAAIVVHLPSDLSSSIPYRRRRALEWLAQAEAYVEQNDASMPVHLLDPEYRMAGGRDELKALLAPLRPWLRFEFSYAVNFSSIGIKALITCLARPDPGALAFINLLRGHAAPESFQQDRVRMLTARRGPRGLMNPLTLQTLYALRERGPIYFPFLDEAKDQDIWRALLTPPGESVPMWVGTGRYAPRPLHPHEVTWVGGSLITCMLMANDGDHLKLSDTGHAFLDSLHKACEDVDMPVRWANRDLTEADGEAMDAWIARTFRKMKTRVNLLDTEGNAA